MTFLKCHYQIVTCELNKLSLPNCRYQIVDSKLSHYQIVITKMSLPKCHNQIVITKLSLPNCQYQNVLTKLSFPNCHFQKSAHHRITRNVVSVQKGLWQTVIGLTHFQIHIQLIIELMQRNLIGMDAQALVHRDYYYYLGCEEL